VIMAGWNNFRSMVTGYEIVPVDVAPIADHAGDSSSSSADAKGAAA